MPAGGDVFLTTLLIQVHQQLGRQLRPGGSILDDSALGFIDHVVNVGLIQRPCVDQGFRAAHPIDGTALKTKHLGRPVQHARLYPSGPSRRERLFIWRSDERFHGNLQFNRCEMYLLPASIDSFRVILHDKLHVRIGSRRRCLRVRIR